MQPFYTEQQELLRNTVAEFAAHSDQELVYIDCAVAIAI